MSKPIVELNIEWYTDNKAEKWDQLVLDNSVNGTFLQSRRFLSYHPATRFKDCSIMIYKKSELIAVVPACEIQTERGKTFSSHAGSTYGGIVVKNWFYNLQHISSIVLTIEKFLKENGYQHILLKITPAAFSEKAPDMLDYFLQKNNYSQYNELSALMRTENLTENVIDSFGASRRRDYRYAEKNNLIFKQLETDEEIAMFYALLNKNLLKYDAKPVHTLEEVLDFVHGRLKEEVDFFGTFLPLDEEKKLIAGSMVFKFKKKVFHTQYLASDPDYLNMYPSNYNDARMIMHAKEQGYEWFSFGISTEDHGKVLNMTLAMFKEGFGSDFAVNRTYFKDIC